jgi:hypothetical protein
MENKKRTRHVATGAENPQALDASGGDEQDRRAEMTKLARRSETICHIALSFQQALMNQLITKNYNVFLKCTFELKYDQIYSAL